jgi:uncharacterized membrane protein YdjX (TVP38/TMEM64 family)
MFKKLDSIITEKTNRERRGLVSYIKVYRFHTAVLAIWVSLIVGLYYYLSEQMITPLAFGVAIFVFITTSGWGPILFMMAYILRTILFFPTTIFTILAGLFFGFWGGFTLTFIGSIVSASVAYWIGRIYNRTLYKPSTSPLTKWRGFLVHNPFVATLVMHLTFLPFDAVNYFSGVMRIRFISFIIGVSLGILPGVISFVSIGASVNLEAVLRDGISVDIIDSKLIILSIFVFIFSLTIARLIKKIH